MSNLNLTVTYAQSAPTFLPGTVVDHIVASITDTSVTPPTSVSQTLPATATLVTFPNVDPGVYTISVVAQDAANSNLGSPVTGTFTVTAPATISLSLPSAVTATQG